MHLARTKTGAHRRSVEVLGPRKVRGPPDSRNRLPEWSPFLRPSCAAAGWVTSPSAAREEARTRGCRAAVHCTITFQGTRVLTSEGVGAWGRFPCDPPGPAGLYFAPAPTARRRGEPNCAPQPVAGYAGVSRSESMPGWWVSRSLQNSRHRLRAMERSESANSPRTNAPSKNDSRPPVPTAASKTAASPSSKPNSSTALHFDATISSDAGSQLPGTLASPRTGLTPACYPELDVRLHHPNPFRAAMMPGLLDVRLIFILCGGDAGLLTSSSVVLRGPVCRLCARHSGEWAGCFLRPDGRPGLGREDFGAQAGQAAFGRRCRKSRRTRAGVSLSDGRVGGVPDVGREDVAVQGFRQCRKSTQPSRKDQLNALPVHNKHGDTQPTDTTPPTHKIRQGTPREER
ncbi:hypothetical protein SAMN02787144_105320 [Streptomyces atratus]|uniref:Uncharacterized protein n=1 Tax=Streptomyces atratus TaxID=1893 RepID=A0A1K2FAL8_STRAR|nr:hypothetical protein SAMN02787144_105320 [Streptomyces atratus]